MEARREANDCWPVRQAQLGLARAPGMTQATCEPGLAAGSHVRSLGRSHPKLLNRLIS